jgi:hypothetical protein
LRPGTGTARPRSGRSFCRTTRHAAFEQVSLAAAFVPHDFDIRAAQSLTVGSQRKASMRTRNARHSVHPEPPSVCCSDEKAPANERGDQNSDQRVLRASRQRVPVDGRRGEAPSRYPPVVLTTIVSSPLTLRGSVLQCNQSPQIVSDLRNMTSAEV